MLKRELYLVDFIKSMFNVGLHLATYTLISFKLGMMVDMANLYVWYQFDWPDLC